MRGFTLIEIVVIIAIALILLGLTVKSFTSLGTSRSLESNASLVVSVLSQARALTLASKDNTQYGVHFSNSQMVLFKDSVYSPTDPDSIIIDLNAQALISNVVLSGGGNDIVFERLTGKTAQNGTVTLSSVSNPANTKSVNIYLTGLAEAN